VLLVSTLEPIGHQMFLPALPPVLLGLVLLSLRLKSEKNLVQLDLILILKK
jgi:hypothetical protein